MKNFIILYYFFALIFFSITSIKCSESPLIHNSNPDKINFLKDSENLKYDGGDLHLVPRYSIRFIGEPPTLDSLNLIKQVYCNIFDKSTTAENTKKDLSSKIFDKTIKIMKALIKKRIFSVTTQQEDEHQQSFTTFNSDCPYESIMKLETRALFQFTLLCSYIINDRALRNSTYTLKADLRLHRFTHGDVIYVYGTSTSGKTTFTKILSKRLPEYILVSTRDLKTKYTAKIISESCPEEYAHVSQFLSIDTILIYIFSGELLIPDELLKNNKYIEIIKNLDEIKSKSNLIGKKYNRIDEICYVFDHIFMLSGKNINVIVDNLDILDFLKYISIYNIHCPLHLLLTYCPINILMERVIKRNHIASGRDLMDKRSLMRPLETFISIYGSTENKSFIDEIQRDDLMETFRTAYSVSQDESDNNLMSKLPWKEIVNILDYNFGTNFRIKLESKYPYSMLLDTSKETSEELAAKILLRTKLSVKLLNYLRIMVLHNGNENTQGV